MKLYKSKPKQAGQQPSWLTTKALDHMRLEHGTDSEAGKDSAAKAAQRAGDTMAKQMEYGMPAPGGKEHVGAGTLGRFKLSKAERGLSAQAQWYVYSSMKISKKEFESTWFQNMLREVGDGDKTAILTPEMLKKYVRAEFSVFLLFLKMIISMKYEIAQGNPFAQGLHDGGTLASKRKYQALALQFVAPNWDANLVITIGLIRSLHNKDKDVSEIWQDTMKARTGYTLDEIVARMRSDRAAKGVAGELDFEEEEVCEMHDTDKLGKVATGALVRSKNKVVVNPFPEGVAFVGRAHKLGTYFGYGNRQNNLETICKNLGDVPIIRISVDYNTTRIAAVHGLLLSEIRLHRALKSFEIEHKLGWEFQSSDPRATWILSSMRIHHVY